jgi:hypothetical protein
MTERPEATWRVETFSGRKYLGQKFRWRIRDIGNGEVLASSEAYRDRNKRDLTAYAIAAPAGAKVLELP